MQEAERELLVKSVGGDGDALSALLKIVSPQLLADLAREFPALSVSDLEDIMQITLLEAFLGIRGVDPNSSAPFFSWLRRIAHNNAYDLTRSRARHPPPIAADESFFDRPEALGHDASTPSRHASLREARSAIESALSQLPESYRNVVRLYDLAGKSPAEVAEQLGRSQGAVFMLRARAHERLREILGSHSRFFSRHQ